MRVLLVEMLGVPLGDVLCEADAEPLVDDDSDGVKLAVRLALRVAALLGVGGCELLADWLGDRVADALTDDDPDGDLEAVWLEVRVSLFEILEEPL